MPELLEWWNLVYVLAFFFALLYAVLNAVGLASHGGADMGLDHDVDAHLDHDMDVHDVHVVHDVHLDHGVHAELSHGAPSLLEEALSFFGIGKVPLSVVLMTFLITFAVVGWGANELLRPVLRTPAAFFPISCGAAVVVGLGGTKLLAGTLGRYIRPIETAALGRGELVGRIATTSLPVDTRFGTALARDEYGTLHKVTCRVAEGAQAIPKGQTVLLVRFVPVKEPGRRAGGHYVVEPYNVPTT